MTSLCVVAGVLVTVLVVVTVLVTVLVLVFVFALLPWRPCWWLQRSSSSQTCKLDAPAVGALLVAHPLLGMYWQRSVILLLKDNAPAV